MSPKELAGSVGKQVRLRLMNATTEVVIISADPEGVICRPASAPEGDEQADFWVSYADIRSAEAV